MMGKIDGLRFQIGINGPVGDVKIADARFIELPSFGKARGEHRELGRGVFGIEPPDHLHDVEHRAVGRCEVLKKFRLVYLHVGDQGGTRLGNHATSGLCLYRLQ